MDRDGPPENGGADSCDGKRGAPSKSSADIGFESHDAVTVAWLQVGDERLAVLSYPATPRGEGLEELTPAEREVAQGVFEGLSNRQIAERRGCATATVANLLSAVYTKLGLSSRSELVSVLAAGDPAA